MEIIKQTSKEYFKTLSIIHFALVIAPVFFVIIILILFFQNTNLNQPDEFFNKVLLYVVSAFYAIGITVNPYIFRWRLASIKKNQDLGYQLAYYRGVLITRYALLEGLTYFALVATLLTYQYIFLAFAALSVLLMFFARPTKENLITDLQLNREEIDRINNPDISFSIIADTNR